MSQMKLKTTAISAAGDIAAAKPGFKVRVFAYGLVGPGKFQEGAGPTDVTGIVPAGLISINQPDFLFETAVTGNKLSITGAAVTGFVTWGYSQAPTQAGTL